MKNSKKKILNAIIAAFMVFGMIVAPIEALAVGAPTIGKAKYGNFTITKVKPAQIKLVSLTKKAQGYKKFYLNASYRLDAKFTDRKTGYKVVGIKARAFKGSKANLIVIKGNIKPSAAKNMLLGSKAAGKKVTIKVPAKQVKAWKAAAKKGVFGKGYKVTIKKI